ncbi:MAG: glycosyltransferase family 2 protein [Deltaproteobacteria bacterium]|nr:glycosyltransferase family 2 protein [Deltaproteobacteria bacterium]
MKPSIDILLSTYNGAAYLPEQLDSLFAQTCQDWRLVVRDDGSSDGTPDILARYGALHPERVAVLARDGKNLGASGSFGVLLARSEAPYVMFCDQDDVWLPDKVEDTLASLRGLERRHGEQTPLLVSTDLKVVDERLAVLDESFWRFQRIHPQRLTKLGRVLMQNFATGCTVMLNRPLAGLALPIPSEAMMHDWWLALVATAFGRVGRLSRPTVLYRQHGRNDVGVSRWSFLAGIENLLLHRDRRRAAVARQEEVYLALERQAEAFAARFGERLPPAERAMLRAFCTMHARGFCGRRRLMLKHGFLHSDRWENLMMLLR